MEKYFKAHAQTIATETTSTIAGKTDAAKNLDYSLYFRL
jgi:hypothetical protein